MTEQVIFSAFFSRCAYKFSLSAGAGHAPHAGAGTYFRYEAKVSKGSPKDTFGIRFGEQFL
ncbi:hypothetical protein [Faecalispora jeddahensis]|uniref:hypothetical protein n=1 Tax=Faecalispora jeddahensis TaxID=1414721 RepID=UPI001896EDC0|nr:hypothetical protein [Faecalispora jeddahensis]